MNSLEIPTSFVDKLRVVVYAGVAGAIGKDPQPAFNEIFRESYRTSEAPYRSPRSYSNPHLEVLESKIYEQAISSYDGGEINRLPWTDGPFSQGIHLAVMLAFADMHNQPTPSEYFMPKESRDFVDRVIEAADEKGRQITLPEQFQIALDIAQGSVLGAAVIAHVGSRSIARESDTRVDPKLDYSIAEVKKWRDCVANFERITDEYDDPPSETYHFWGTFIAGLLSETGDRRRDKIFNPIYRQLYTKMAEISELLRYRLARKKGLPHKEADLVGYHLGSMVGASLQSSE